MRIWVAAAVALAALTIPDYAHSQQRGRPPVQTGNTTEEHEPQVDEKQYKAAVGRLGGQQQGKYDPWQNMRDKPAK